MLDQQQIQNNASDDLDEVLVKEPDGTFRIVKMASAQAPLNQSPPVGGSGTGQAPRVVQPAPMMRSLADDEEQEVAGLAKKANALGATSDTNTDDRVRLAIKQSGIILADQTLAGRLSAVLAAYCKEVRNEQQTRELLMKQKEAGGLALTMHEAARLTALLATGVKPTPPAPTPISVTPSLPVVQKTIPVPSVVATTASPTSPVKPILPPAPLNQSPPVGGSGTGQAPKPATLRPMVQSPQTAQRPLPEAKPIVQDVSFSPTLVGPVDELRMSLITWRRMAATIKDRATKIEEKLRLLEEESYPERLKGIAAWYGSEVVRQYEDVGRASLMAGKSVAEILAERQVSSTSPLSLEEFQSIAELNENLRF